jgi:hypothetical protein
MNALLYPLMFAISMPLPVAACRAARPPRRDLQAIIERAAKEPDLDGAGLVLSSLLADHSQVRLVFSAPIVMDERSVYILIGGHWGSRAVVTWKDNLQLQRVRAESVSSKPLSIRAVLRADRYEAYLRKRKPGGAATINSFPFFEYSPYADDLAEIFIETLRKAPIRPASAVVAPGKAILMTSEEMETNLLSTWQMLCGTCDRLDLIEKVTPENWRGRFPELDRWFQRNRPYVFWDNSKSCIGIDESAKELGRPTPRASRLVPELKPPWVMQQEMGK